MIVRLQIGVQWALAGVLALAAVLKLVRPRASVAALANLGLRRHGVRWAAWASISALELALATGVALGSAVAAYSAAALLGVFALVLVRSLGRGASGAPCGCFGPRSRIGWAAVARNVALSAGFAVVPVLPDVSLSADAWLALGVAVVLVAVLVLAVAVLALAREIGVLRLQLPPQSAIEIPEEGPPLGVRTDLIEQFPLEPEKQFAVAVFASQACQLCRSLAPAITAFGRDPLVALRVFDEDEDADAWRALRIPGSPFAVALDRDGTVRAKGTFNTFGQLESVVAAAERRARAEVHA